MIVWVVAGYSLAFSTNPNGDLQKFIGGLGSFLLSDIRWNDLRGTYPI